MSIFGSFDELPFPDVVSMLERRAGYLRVWSVAGGKRYTFHLNKGVLQALQVETTWLTDVFELREAVVSVMQASQGEFEFERCDPTKLATGLDRPLQQLLLSASSAVDEIITYRSHFADVRTRFRLVSNLDSWTDYDLQQFWQHGQAALKQGASAEELAPRLGMGLENVQLYLYKLRTLGVLAPVQEFRQQAQQRRHAVQLSTQSSVAATANVQPVVADVPDLTDEFADLIAWADELDQNSSPSSVDADSSTSSHPASPYPVHSQTQHTDAKHSRQQVNTPQVASQPSDRQETMIQRMIRALSFGKRL
ncbi:MAG: DUF4388 domain-containing protein [Deinococcota bacterium]